MARSLKSFLWTVVLLIILMYCVAVYFTELAFDLRNKHPEKDFGSVNRTWGALAASLLSPLELGHRGFSMVFHWFSIVLDGFSWFLHGFGWDSGSGSISNSIFSLFQAITGGNDWHVFISVFEDYVGTNTSTWPVLKRGRKHPEELRKLGFAGFRWVF